MCEMTGFSDNEDSSKQQGGDDGIFPKVEVLDCDLPNSMHIGDNVASSSASNVRSSLIGMGFKPSLVDRAIEKHGDSNIEVLLETLFSYSADQRPNSEASSDGLFCSDIDLAGATHATEPLDRSNSADSLDSLFDDENGADNPSSGGRDAHVKEELDECAGVSDEKRQSLLRMSFSSDEIEFAIDKLGVDAHIDELVDFIFAARIAGNCERDTNGQNHYDNEKNKECDPEALFGIMEKILRLLEMGFSENEISAAIDKHGTEVPLQVLADSIVGGPSSSPDRVPKLPATVKVEERQAELFRLLEKVKGKRPKEEYTDEPSILKKPKQEGENHLSTFSAPTWVEARNGNSMPIIGHRVPASGRRGHRADNFNNSGRPRLTTAKTIKVLDRTVIEPPYFFYGNVSNLSHRSWVKISQFLYEIEPEFVNTSKFSALERTEGYVHNLSAQGRFHIHPKAPMTIEEAIPHTSKWWPLWDTRKQISGISSDTSRTSQICDSLGKMLIASQGVLSKEKQRDLVHQCEALNLVWVGQHRLAPIDPEHLERILGYPPHHTRVSGFSLTERLQALENTFQVNTLAYHLSVLKPLHPGGVTVLSVFSGLGGAELALYKLGIYLRGVVSIEPSEIRRRILKQWWEKSAQSGKLVQIEGIQTLSSSKLDGLIQKLGGFDLVICQNPSANSSSLNFDFSLFYEFVRVLQHVRNSAKERNG